MNLLICSVVFIFLTCLRMFPNIQSSVTLLKVLKKIQDEERRYSEPKDESGMRASKRKRTPFPRNHIIWHFDKGCIKYI